MPTRQDSQLYQSLDHELPAYRRTQSWKDSLSPSNLTSTAHERLAKMRPWWATVLAQTFALLWMAPILTLLILNFKGFIIGPTAWCISRHCYAETFNIDTAATQEKLHKFNHDDHNLLGALQLVAKALEVWFEMIASFFVYLVTMQVASKREGLPIAYLMSPFEFSRVPALFDFLLWKVAPPLFGAKSKAATAYRHRVWLLLMMIILLCTLCNLMGPATAVLVLPTLQWVDTDKIGNLTFLDLNAASSPRPDGWFLQKSNCSTAESAATNYSCALPAMGDTLDSWMDSMLASDGSGVTQQDSLSFSINNTLQASSDRFTAADYNNSMYWAPSREIISSLNNDSQAVAYISLGLQKSDFATLQLPTDSYDSYTEYNKSLQLSLQRNGPILGGIVNSWYSFNDSSRWTVSVDAERQIRCYSEYDLGTFDGFSTGNYTRCIRLGSGWSSLNKVANFSVAGPYHYQQDVLRPNVSVVIYSSDKAVYLPNGTIPEWLPERCLGSGDVPQGTNCDYNRLFTVDPMDPIANRTSNTNTIEMSIRDGNTSAILAADYVAFSGFTTYTLDPSPLTNPSSYVQTQDIDYNETAAVHIDPTWMLAAWSVGNGTMLYPDRASTRAMADAMQSLLQIARRPDSQVSSPDETLQEYVTLLPIMQTLSIIDFDTKAGAASDASHPILQRNARMNVWAYDISSRTAILGSVVAITGIVVTLIQFVFSLIDRRPFRSSTQILIAALQHGYQGEFIETETEEQEGRVRFHIKDSYNTEGKLTFHHTQ